MGIALWHMTMLASAFALLATSVALIDFSRWLVGRNRLLYAPLGAAYTVATLSLLTTGIAYVVKANSAPAMLVGSLAIWATVFAITAGLGEVREALPRQQVSFGMVTRESDSGSQESAIRFTNPLTAPLIRTYRLEATLYDTDGEIIAVPLAPYTPDPGTFLLSTEVNRPRPEWVQDWREFVDGAEEARYYAEAKAVVDLYSWIRERDEAWWPGQMFLTPWVELDPELEPSHWVVTWWTERAGPKEVFVDIATGEVSSGGL